jgi:hypothetical protein
MYVKIYVKLDKNGEELLWLFLDWLWVGCGIWYNIMFGTSLLLLGAFLASIIEEVLSFEIKIGSAASLLKDFNLESV